MLRDITSGTQHMGNVITFAQQKGGAGKTTVLAHLAAAWAEAGRSVAIIDLDPQRSLTRWAGLREDPAITVVESKDYRAGSDMKTARRSFDFVLVDCPGAASSLLDAAIRESDLVIAPCQPSVMDIWALDTVLAAARKAKRPLRILLNRVPARLGSLEEVLSALGENRALLLASQFGNRNGFSQAMIAGRTAPELARRSTAAAETYGLRAELAALLPRL
jgi:chromosome partitioning protein